MQAPVVLLPFCHLNVKLQAENIENSKIIYDGVPQLINNLIKKMYGSLEVQFSNTLPTD